MKYYESVQFRIPFKSHRSIRSIPWHLEILETLHRFMSKERTGNFFEQLERSRAAWEHLRWLCHCHCMSLVWVSINVEHIEHSQSVLLSDWFLFLCRWQPDSTCLLTECQHRSSGRPVFSQLTTSLHGAIYYNIYIFSLIKLLLLSTWLIFCMLLWVKSSWHFFPSFLAKARHLGSFKSIRCRLRSCRRHCAVLSGSKHPRYTFCSSLGQGLFTSPHGLGLFRVGSGPLLSGWLHDAWWPALGATPNYDPSSWGPHSKMI